MSGHGISSRRRPFDTILPARATKPSPYFQSSTETVQLHFHLQSLNFQNLISINRLFARYKSLNTKS